MYWNSDPGASEPESLGTTATEKTGTRRLEWRDECIASATGTCQKRYSWKEKPQNPPPRPPPTYTYSIDSY